MTAISAPCNTKYHADTANSGKRPLSAVKLLVLHSTEGGTAAGVARMFSGKGAEGSAHLVIDDKACYRCLRNDEIPWAAPSANTQGFHIEQCGYAKWSAAEWEKHLPMLHRVAYKLALHSKAFKIPLVYLDAARLKAGKKGVTTHAQVSLAWPNSQGNHHDPGTGYPMALVLSLAKHYAKEMAV
jgi:hypothetical protein